MIPIRLSISKRRQFTFQHLINKKILQQTVKILNLSLFMYVWCLPRYHSKIDECSKIKSYRRVPAVDLPKRTTRLRQGPLHYGIPSVGETFSGKLRSLLVALSTWLADHKVTKSRSGRCLGHAHAQPRRTAHLRCGCCYVIDGMFWIGCPVPQRSFPHLPHFGEAASSLNKDPSSALLSLSFGEV